ncbi:MAG: ABC transporter ATP-binding protein [Clostridiales Family XIII bacterium]|jgi:ABC-2 type transport system ATP-binding protein|nr:ABC transporter ATP-binding protein [Clostridiales Family XIII bacterium]
MDIKLDSVSKSFGKNQVLADISFSIPSGEIICLLGPSGSGKTTIIRLMIGAIATDSGTIHFGDTSVPNLNLLGKIGFMPQADALYDDLSGEGNLKFFARLYGMKLGVAKKRIDETLALVGLSGDRKKLVRQYSGGMKKRLSLAAALIHEPEVLLLDEPTVGIDPVLRRTIWQQFQAIRRSGKTILVSTHLMDEVSECDKAALLYNGRLIQYAPVDELLAKTVNGKIEELFLAAGAAGAAGATGREGGNDA